MTLLHLSLPKLTNHRLKVDELIFFAVEYSIFHFLMLALPPMIIKTIIVDDDDVWRSLTTTFAQMIPLLQIEGVYPSSQEAYARLTEGDIDLALLDIDMPILSGLGMAKSLKNPPQIIFISSHANYALDSYEVEAADFITKPFDLERLMKGVEKVRRRIENAEFPKQSTDDNFFFIRSQSSFIKIQYDELLYVKAMENFVQIVTESNKHTVLIPLSTVENQLPNDIFMRSHRSYIVNLKNITSVERETVHIGENAIPLSDQFREKLMQSIVEKNLLKK